MHDSFVRIFHRIDRFRWSGPGSLYSWMSRVAINLCFDSSKKRKRLAEQLSERMEDLDIPDSDEPDVLPDIPPETLKAMVEGLPDAYGTVFKLHAVDGLSHQEIGKILGIKESSSSSNFARARAILIKTIKDFIKQSEI